MHYKTIFYIFLQKVVLPFGQRPQRFTHTRTHATFTPGCGLALQLPERERDSISLRLPVNDLIPRVEEAAEVELRDGVASLTDIKCTLVYPLSEAMFYEIKESLHRNVNNLLWQKEEDVLFSSPPNPTPIAGFPSCQKIKYVSCLIGCPHLSYRNNLLPFPRLFVVHNQGITLHFSRAGIAVFPLPGSWISETASSLIA